MREALWPASITWTLIAATCGGLLAIAMVVAVIIALSPAVPDLDKRPSNFDDKDLGRVTALRARVRALEAWRPRVVRD